MLTSLYLCKSCSLWNPALAFSWLLPPFCFTDGCLRQAAGGHVITGDGGGGVLSATHQLQAFQKIIYLNLTKWIHLYNLAAYKISLAKWTKSKLLFCSQTVVLVGMLLVAWVITKKILKFEVQAYLLLRDNFAFGKLYTYVHSYVRGLYTDTVQF